MPVSADDLFVKPVCRSFVYSGDRSAERNLVSAIKEHQAHTRRIDVNCPSDAFLNAEGLVRGKFRFSQNAFFEFTKHLGAGAGQLIYNVITGRRSGWFISKNLEEADVDLGLTIYNDLTKLRLGGNRRMQFIVDTKSNVIEGVVGHKYRLLFNADLYEKVVDFVRSARPRMRFGEAFLEGRRLLLRFETKSPVASIKRGSKDDVFRGGFNFTNSETGNVAIRAAGLVAREEYGLKAVGESMGDLRMSHVRGVRFEKRLHFLLEAVQRSALSGKDLQTRLDFLSVTPMGIGGSPKKHEAVLKKWKSRLVKEGLHQHITREALARVCLCGSDEAESAYSLPVFAKRTQYDLFNSIMYVASGFDVGWREQAERVAYRLLTGRFVI